MSEMIERVAHAMGDLADRLAAAEGCDEIGVLDADFLLDLAAEAIQAMREPTDEMKIAAVQGMHRGMEPFMAKLEAEGRKLDALVLSVSCSSVVTDEVWRGSIAAALNSDAKDR